MKMTKSSWSPSVGLPSPYKEIPVPTWEPDFVMWITIELPQGGQTQPATIIVDSACYKEPG